MDVNSVGEIDDVGTSTTAYIKKKYPVLFPTLVVLIILAALALAVSFFFPEYKWLQYAAILVIFGCLSWRASVESKIQSMFMDQLGQAIGFKYEATGNLASFKGHFLEIGRAQQVRDVLTGTYRNMPVRIFTYSFTVGSGKSTHTYNFTGFELQANVHLPDILIHPQSMWVLVGLVDDWKPDGTKILSLEGNFNEYFKVFAPECSEVEALQLLAPDVMADLIDNYKSFVIEFSGNAMYVISTEVIRKKDSFTNMLSLVDKLYDKLLPTLNEMSTKTTAA